MLSKRILLLLSIALLVSVGGFLLYKIYTKPANVSDTQTNALTESDSPFAKTVTPEQVLKETIKKYEGIEFNPEHEVVYLKITNYDQDQNLISGEVTWPPNFNQSNVKAIMACDVNDYRLRTWPQEVSTVKLPNFEQLSFTDLQAGLIANEYVSFSGLCNDVDCTSFVSGCVVN